MVFMIQGAQNRDSEATSLQLNEQVAVIAGTCPGNRLIGVEDLSEAELHVVHEPYRERVHLTQKDVSLDPTHSIEEAQRRHRSQRQ